MNFQCIKTGFHAWLVPEQVWLVGDAFGFHTVSGLDDKVENWLFRVSGVGVVPLRPVKHFEIFDFYRWFDQHDNRVSTLISKHGWVQYIGYDGVAVPGFDARAVR